MTSKKTGAAATLAALAAALLAGCASSSRDEGAKAQAPTTMLQPPAVVTRTEYVAQPSAGMEPVRGRGDSGPRPSPLQAARRAVRDGTFVPDARDYIGATYQPPFVQNYRYDVFTAEGDMTDIDLQPNEVPYKVKLGDGVLFQVDTSYWGPEGNRTYTIHVKPLRAGQNTQLSVATDRRKYTLNVRSFRWDKHVAVRFTYPEDSLAEVNAQLASLQKGTEAARRDNPLPGCRHARYRVDGSGVDWLPVRTEDGLPAVCDDGERVRINFPPSLGSIQGPSVFQADDANGTNARMVNFRVVGASYVVDGTPPVLLLRDGVNKVAIVRTGG